MAKYEVTLPISGYVVVEVEAADEQAAIETALDGVSDKDQIEEWSAHEYVLRGNVWYGVGSPSADVREI